MIFWSHVCTVRHSLRVVPTRKMKLVSTPIADTSIRLGVNGPVPVAFVYAKSRGGVIASARRAPVRHSLRVVPAVGTAHTFMSYIVMWQFRVIRRRAPVHTSLV